MIDFPIFEMSMYMYHVSGINKRPAQTTLATPTPPDVKYMKVVMSKKMFINDPFFIILIVIINHKKIQLMNKF